MLPQYGVIDDNRENEHTSANSQKCGMKHVIGYFALHSSHFLSASAAVCGRPGLVIEQTSILDTFLSFSFLLLHLGNFVVRYSVHITDSGGPYKLRGAKV